MRLTEAVHAGPKNTRSFMCGALSEKNDAAHELEFALSLIRNVVHGLPPERLAYHICRGNWTPNESAALTGDYQPLLEFLSGLPVGTLFLEFCTSRAGSMASFEIFPATYGSESVWLIKNAATSSRPKKFLPRAENAMRLFGPDRVLLTPDCGFARFADNPISSATVAEAKLSAIAEADRILRQSSDS